jgi:protein O-GlcNAc transferase
MPEFDALLTEAAAAAESGRVDDALAAYRRASALSPSNPGLQHNIGVLLARRGDLRGAIEHLIAAERLNPHSPVSSLALGHTCFGAGRMADAAAAFERALQRAPDSQEATDNLGLTLHALGESTRALPILARARVRRPYAENIFRAQFEALQAMDRLEEADQAFLQFQSGAAPSAWLAATGLRWARMSTHAEFEAKFVSMAAALRYTLPDLRWLAALIGSVQYFDFRRAEIAELYRSYNALMQQFAGGAPAGIFRSVRTSGPLRIGYLSSDFRRHVMGDLMLSVFACHDRGRFEVFAYSLLPQALEDATTARFRTACDGYLSVADLDDFSAAKRITEDRIDVLVDLTSHTPQARPGILLRRPAPVIVAHLGDHGTIGLEQVDFKLTDAIADLPDAASYQIEAPLAMDGCVMPFRRVRPAAADPAGRARLRAPEGAVIFGVFSGTIKMSARALELWRRILDAVPNARLAISPFVKVELDRSVSRLQAAGIAADRILVVQPSADDAVNRARYRHVDVLLDTLPYTGGDSTVAALDMGVPVVTRVGERQAERMGLSLLSHIGVTDTAAHSDDDYVAIACRLAAEPAWRRELSTRILSGIAASGIDDFGRYTRNLEAALERAVTLKSRQGR